MTIEDIQLLLKNIGPIKESKIQLGDITVLFGPPNTGKSYTLKALYSQISLNDKIILRNVIKEFNRILDPFIREFYSLCLISLTILALSNMLTNKNLGLRKLDEVIDRINKSKNVKVSTRIEGNRIEVSTLLMPLPRVTIDDIPRIEEPAYWDVINVGDNSNIELIPKSISVVDLFFERVIKECISILQKEGFKVERGEDCVKFSKGNSEIVINVDKYRISKLSQFNKTSIRSITIKDDIIKPLLIGESNEKLKNALIDYINNNRIASLINFIEETLNLMEIGSLSEGLYEIININIDNMIDEIVDGTKPLRGLFIPYGRSQLLYQLEYISRAPIIRAEPLKNNIIMDSYLLHLDLGRSYIIENKANKDIVDLFSLLLNGKLEYKSHRLFYVVKDEYIPIELTSALVSEVSGIFLPLLTMPNNSIILIEEPESQLHPVAQVLMVLIIIALAKRFNYKFVLTTHSDLIAVVLAVIQEKKEVIKKDRLRNMIYEICKIEGSNPDDEIVNKLIESIVLEDGLKIGFYYYNPADGFISVEEQSCTDILNRMKSITDTIDIVINWLYGDISE